MSLPHEITHEEYISIFNAKNIPGYPKKLKYKDDFYDLNIRKFEYKGKHFMKAEVWKDKEEKLYSTITLVKTPRARYHSPSNSQFNIELDIVGTELGVFLLKEMLLTLIKMKIAFIVEDIYPEDIMYNALSKSYDEELYKKVEDFYNEIGFEITFDKEKGKGFIIYKDKKLNKNEKKYFEMFISK
jgi:hypothetical protein